MDIWAQLWPNPYPGGKAHRSVIRALLPYVGLFTRFETIIAMVTISGIRDEDDQIATSRAIRDIRDEWRKAYNPDRKAICA